MFKSVIFLQAFKSPGKAQPVSMLLEAGRSFSPAVMSQSDEDDVDSAFRPEGARVSYIFFAVRKGRSLWICCGRRRIIHHHSNINILAHGTFYQSCFRSLLIAD